MRNIKLAVIFVFVFAVGGLFLLNSGAVTGQVGDALSAPTRVSATDSVLLGCDKRGDKLPDLP